MVVGDNSYAVLDLLYACQSLPNPVTMIARLRMDAALYEPAPPPAGKKGRPRKKGQRLPTLQYLLEHPTTIWQSVCLKWYGGKETPDGDHFRYGPSGIIMAKHLFLFAGC